jgi:hypothetical protein
MRQGNGVAAAEQILVEALRDDEPALASFAAFKDLARKLVEAHGITLTTTWTPEQHAIEAAACRARAREWSEIAEKAARDKDEALALLATKAATEADRSADHHAACARGAT